MTPSAPSSKLPAWIFYATDLVLLAAAGFVAARAPQPLPNSATFAIVACVIAGAIVATIPRLVNYEREKNEALDERQRALEALAGTVANSAEQISVAAAGLHTIAELVQKNLRHAEQLPHKLQEKIAEFQAQVANADNVEKEELENELTALRSSESERLETISDRIAKSTAELARLEASVQKQFTAIHDALGQAPAQAAAALEEKLRGTLTALDARLASVATGAPAPRGLATASPFRATAQNSPSSGTNSSPATPPSDSEGKPDGTAHPLRRPRKPRHEESSPGTGSFTPSPLPIDPAFPAEEPPPVKLKEITPVAPGSQSPYAKHLVAESLVGIATSAVTTATASGFPTSKSPRKPTVKKPPGAETDNALGLEIATQPGTASGFPASAPAVVSEFNQLSPEESAPAAVAADGATRLLVTAYIGIGNRLFIRGEGPGLSWEKGVPLQFVSIGKWRWETPDATEPVKFKLYKNDESECTALGLQSLAPGYQQELVAAF